MRMPVIVPMLMGMGVCVRRVCTGMIGRMYGRFLVNSTHIRTSVFFCAHSTTAALKSQFFSPNRQKTDDNRHIS